MNDKRSVDYIAKADEIKASLEMVTNFNMASREETAAIASGLLLIPARLKVMEEVIAARGEGRGN